MRASTGDKSCWIATDGVIGNEKQCLALAHYLGLEVEVFRISLRQPWQILAPYLKLGGRFALPETLQERLAGPLPEVLITAGRRSALAAVIIKRLSQNRTFSIQLLNPRIDPANFDVVICPRHDKLAGPNVITTLGALHGVDEQTLQSARRQWARQLEALPAPRVAVLIGASNRAYTIDRDYLARLADAVEGWIQAAGGSVMVTTSRRTPKSLQEYSRQRFARVPGWVWTGQQTSDNPYLGFLAWADRIVVSADSVNMLSEACGTGKPVYCPVPKSKRPKFALFHQTLREAGLTLPLDYTGQAPGYQPLHETRQIAQQLALQIDQHG